MNHRPMALAIHRFSRGGGLESYALSLAKQIIQDQRPLTVYASHFDGSLHESKAIQQVHIDQKKVLKKLRPFLFAAQLDKVRNRQLPLVAINQADNADVLICGGTHLGYLQHMNQTANPIDWLHIRRNKTSYHTAKKIMAHSHLMQRELVELYDIDPERIEVLHPPIDTSRFHNDFSQNAEIRARYGFGEEDTVFLFPSLGHKRKGLNLLSNFFAQSKLPIKLAVAGKPMPQPMKNVIELGYCDNMPELYRAADFTIMASLYEPFGLIGVESVLSGTRVVLSENMACREVLSDDAGFFFSRRQPETLTHAIEQAIELKKQGKHKIHDVQAALKYNPSLQYHVQRLYEMLDMA